MSGFQVPAGKLMDSVMDSTARINLWHGSVRSAKTVTSAFRWYEYCTADEAAGGGPKGVPLLMAGQTERTLYRNVVEPMEEMFGTERVEWLPGVGAVRIGDRLVYAMGAGDVRGERKLRGMTLGGAYVDEATILPEDFWNRLTDRLSVPGAKLFATTNPDSPRHYLKVKWIDRAGEIDLRAFKFTLDDNPHLDPEYVAALKAEHVGVWYRRYIMGEWVAAEGAIWPQFDPEVHVVDEVPLLLSQLVAFDYGSTNPTVGLLMGVGTTQADPVPRVYVAREWRWDSRARGRSMTDAEQSGEVTKWLQAGAATPEWEPVRAGPLPFQVEPRTRIVDPSAASFILQLQADRHPGVQGADNRVQPGLRAVATLLAADRLRVHRSCAGLLDEIPGYGWDEKAVARGEEKPMKVADHGCDSLRYGIMRLWSEWRSWVASGAAFGPSG